MFLQDLDDFQNHPLISFEKLIVDFKKMRDFERGFNFFFPFKIEIEGFEPYWLKKDDFGEILLNILEMNDFGEKS